MLRGILMLGCTLLAAAGCRAPRSDVLEAELRTKDRQVRELEEENRRLHFMTDGMERSLVGRQGGPIPPVAGNVLVPRDIVMGTGTGPFNNNASPGDEGIEVVITPRDEDGQPVRAMGAATVIAQEILPGGAKALLSSWEVSSVDLRRTWRGGLLMSGYHLVLPWKVAPTQRQLRITVQFHTPDGRLLEAEKDISIRPYPPSAVPTLPPIVSERAAELGAQTR